MNEKADAELKYWESRFRAEGGKLQNSWYRRLMCSVCGQDEKWFDGKVVCDFGSGPRGSLEWANGAAKRICADVLVDSYSDLGIRDHQAIYVETSEERIPLPSGYCDVVLTINSLDHVDNLRDMCQEILRITKFGGAVAGSINLNEPSTPTEPQTITEELFMDILGNYLIMERVIRAPKFHGQGAVYKHLFDHVEDGSPLPEMRGEVGYLWFLGRKY